MFFEMEVEFGADPSAARKFCADVDGRIIATRQGRRFKLNAYAALSGGRYTTAIVIPVFDPFKADDLAEEDRHDLSRAMIALLQGGAEFRFAVVGEEIDDNWEFEGLTREVLAQIAGFARVAFALREPTWRRLGADAR